MKVLFSLICSLLLTGCDAFRQDQCLDAGGGWNPNTQQCEM